MNDKEALEYLRQAAASGSRLGLSRITELTERLYRPQDAVPAVHISGTNGKGSVGAMLASVLRAAGYRTGHFATPALSTPYDCYQIGGIPVPPSVFAAAMTEVRAHAEQMTDPPTEYELIAAAAFAVFRQQHCAVSVIECCMGGDTDCTNVIRAPLLSVITNVALDHCAFLGSTTAEIAAHKAGIIKHGCPALTGCTDPAAIEVIRSYAERIGAPLFFPDDPLQITAMSPEGTDCISREYGALRLGTAGLYQPENAATVLRAVSVLRGQGLRITDDAVRKGLCSCRWAGRMELLRRNPYVLFDGAHNPDGMKTACESLTRFFGAGQQISFVIGVMADKDYTQYAEMLRPLAAGIYTVTPDNPRALPAERLAAVFAEAGLPAAACRTVGEAVSAARQTGRTVVGLGSLYLYREFCGALESY
ncbi:MAG: bifunctional folylpolyglutamate synthase/dihydrofolate synthase [Oscillospiraceae bacterium]|nr:bifunctional folylpolyglutamate synthase/dihydrofolate synthase [Oscillospiraceae bacterium]MCR5305031.1 bifunctional folylpolyglutamate synthase/dihydrofolate synthase [Oscillospiraceae bacterium]